MSITEFVKKWNGIYVEVAGTTAKNQCVDLANLFIRDFLGLPIIEYTNAKDFPSKAGDKYDYILNSPTGVPEEGDLVIWGGTYGHIAIFIEGNANRFTSFDENFPIGSPCHVQEHNYTSPVVLGWLHFKGQLPTDDLLKQRADAFVAVADRLQKPVDKDIILADIDKFLKYESLLVDKDRLLSEKDKQIEEMAKEVDAIDKKAQKLEDENRRLETALQALTRSNERQTEEISKLKVKIAELQQIQPIEQLSSLELLLTAIRRFIRRR